ncbi:SusC/RagA family TonB-linked outer membrane protein [Marinifilum sp.]|uniref:SusC/RagA family TonB-linked outer membrane protein n=1 Tax=Marinifilum sp. TaxID=2033137 RepID=UPI003BAA4EE9
MKCKLKRLLKPAVLFLLLGFGLMASAQNQTTLRGYVYDKGEPPMSIPGVTVHIPATNTGAVTNFQGYFEIRANEGDSIQFSFVGYKTFKTKVKNLMKSMTVSLEEDVEKLEEVIVVGETTMQKQHVAATVERVDVVEALQGKPVTNLSQSLQGGVTGVRISQSSGKPGSDQASINIRGVTTLDNSGALILVDGIEMSMDDINPDIVESMTVLKDAAAAAIYGSRAGKGVVLIETKRGVPGEMRASYSGYVGIQTPTRLPKFVDAVTYMNMYNEAEINDGSSPSFSQYDIDNTASGLYPVSYPDTDWVGEVVDKSSIVTNHSFSASGGNSLARINLSGRYLFQDGMIDYVKARKFNFRANSTVTMAKNLLFYIDASFSRDLNEQPSNYDPILRSMYENPPTMIDKFPMKPGVDKQFYGKYSGDLMNNPLLYTEQGGSTKRFSDRSLMNFRIKYNLGENWRLSASYNFVLDSKHKQVSRKPFALYNYWTDELIKEWDYKFSGDTEKIFSSETKLKANFNKDFGQHKLNAVVGTSLRNKSPDEFNKHEMLSFYGKISYSLKNKYLFEATTRYDGSSKFDEKEKWGVFPSFALGWNVHKENFLENSNLITYLKLRGSWGQLGNNNVGLYNFQSTIDPKNGTEKVIGNRNLKWETVTMTNLGVDLGLFHNQAVELNFEVYRKVTTDMILKPPISQIVGVGAAKGNLGEMVNEGFEVSLNIQKKLSDKLKFSFGTGLAFNRNKIEKLEGGPYISGWGIKEEGYSVNDYYGYKTDGLIQIGEIENGLPIFAGQEAGDIKFLDLNRDGVLTEKDMTHIGRSNAKFDAFTNLKIKYKSFDISAQLTGTFGLDGRATGRVAYPFYNGGKPQEHHVGSYWTPENPNAYYPRLSLKASGLEQQHDYFLRDASYIRLRNVQVGYTLNRNTLQKIGIRGLRLYVNARNPHVWTKMKTLDPESRGNDETYPIMATYTMGMKLNF